MKEDDLLSIFSMPVLILFVFVLHRTEKCSCNRSPLDCGQHTSGRSLSRQVDAYESKLWSTFSTFGVPMTGVKVEKYPHLKERRLSEKEKKHVCSLQPYLSCMCFHHLSWKTNRKVMRHVQWNWNGPNVLSSKRETNAYKPASQWSLLLHLRCFLLLASFKA